jgi:hypothetical protein
MNLGITVLERKERCSANIVYRIWAKLFGSKIENAESIVSLFAVGGYFTIPQRTNLTEEKRQFELSPELQPILCSHQVKISVPGPWARPWRAMVLAAIAHCIGLPAAEEN